ncbi:hypothetical protein B0T26DRAFT_762156 [Lasiosphaeria miniovina]|uniref:Uncharacterized protein n=1 Tax=Lasiosphaeria miniovina TaxID=1954250 RepID=A0AA40BIH8_9PEZI|nr:uncharacterized protein B0T26DRAFT_762156 [Lasiosphaeria miniovina]KAK0734693.1 hypothetical protein B0T26DRAFT_762156 [Lasiosphaeria miniovina]
MSDPEKRPLLDIRFFQMRYAMQHIFAGIQAAGALQAIFGGEPPDDDTPGSGRDEPFLPTDWDNMLREALELGILSERTEAIWRKSLLERAYHEALQKDREYKEFQPTKTGSGICSLKEEEKEERLPMQQSKHDDSDEEQKGMPDGREKGKQKISISTGSGIGLKEEKEERLPMQQSKHNDSHEEQKEMPEGRERGKQKTSISTDKGKGTDNSEGKTLKLTRKLSKLSLKGSYRRLKEAPGKFKRPRVASLFHKPKEEERVREQES